MIEMAESSALNSDSKVGQGKDIVELDIPSRIKTEVDVTVKPEPQECAVCVSRSQECFSMFHTCTSSGDPLHRFLAKYTHADLASAHHCSKLICKACLDLINVLEQAEIEYVKLKETFEAIIHKNPLFESPPQPITLSAVKAEVYQNGDKEKNELDSEDEPLAQTKKKKPRKEIKRKKKPSSTVTKQRVQARTNVQSDYVDSWECEDCGATGTGGAVEAAAHRISIHTLGNTGHLRDVKTEDSADGSQSPYFETDSPMEPHLKIEFDHSDDQCSTDTLEPSSDKKSRKNKIQIKIGKMKSKHSKPVQKKKHAKVEHQCDQCDAKYSSWIRLERHKQSHDGSKPPYICEVCGAHYKHKRACDIHIALHKGISNWKCEECDKLFPSKSALQRHNNIHTGKLNYQCDLCGKSFIHTSSFKMHKLSHSGVKPHSCDVCGLALMTRSHLKRHKRVHSGEKRHECPICGKRFSERYNLAAHSRSHAAPPAEPRAPARRLFRCPYCPERYERRYMLERHTAQAHGCTLERPLPTPRNTMSKLLKAQAQRRVPAEPASKEERSTDSRSPPPPQKLAAHIASSASLGAASSWSGAYAAEFGLRPDYTH